MALSIAASSLPRNSAITTRTGSRQTHTPETARGLLQREAFRDELSARAADAAHQVMLSQLRTELRTRHYSLRTEQAYEHWMRRFVIFHKLKSPRVLG
jgi:hypothetical protein